MEKKVKKKKKIIIPCAIVGALLLIIIVANIISSLGKAGSADYLVEIEPVEYRDLSDTISLKGTVSGESKTNVSSLASAKVTELNVQVGDVVQSGDLLCVMDSSDISDQIAQLQKSVSNTAALSANEKNQNNQNLANAQADQKTALTTAQKSIDEAQAVYNNTQKIYNNCTNSLNSVRATQSTKAAAYTAALAETNTAKTAMDEAQAALDATPGDATLQTTLTNATNTYTDKKAISDAKKTEYDAASASVSAAEADWKVACDNYNAAAKTLDSAKSQYNATATETNRSIAGLQNTVDMQKYQTGDTTAKNQLEALQEQLSGTKVYAPCGGVVTAVNVSVGDNNTAGSTMVTIEDTSVLKIVVTVNEADILKLEEGMKAVIKTDATGEAEIAGYITRVVRVKNQSTGTNADTASTAGYSAEITIEDANLLVGMNAKAKVILKDKKDTLSVPYDLVQYDEAGNAYVLVAEMKDNGEAKAIRKNITVGEEVDYYIEVTGGDLKAGDLLIYDTFITEGQTFKPSTAYLDGNTEDAQ